MCQGEPLVKAKVQHGAVRHQLALSLSKCSPQGGKTKNMKLTKHHEYKPRRRTLRLRSGRSGSESLQARMRPAASSLRGRHKTPLVFLWFGIAHHKWFGIAHHKWFGTTHHKWLLVLLIVAFSVLAPFAQAAPGVPKILNHQGRLLDSSSNLLGGAGTDFCFKFAFYDDDTVGSPDNQLWPSGATSTMTINVKNGVFDAGIGDTSIGGDLLDFDFQNTDTVYLGIDVATQVGGSCAGGDEVFERLNPRKRILSSGYTLNASTVFGTGQSAIGTTTPIADTALTVEATSTAIVPLAIRGFLGQTADLFRIVTDIGERLLTFTAGGNLGIGTTSPYTRLSVVGEVVMDSFNATSTTASSTISHGLNVLAINQTGNATSTFTQGIDLSAGCFAISGTCITGGGASAINDLSDVTITSAVFGHQLQYDGGAWVNVATSTFKIALSDTTGTLQVSSGGTGATSFISGSIIFSDGTDLTQDNTNLFFDDTNNRLSLGTTTPYSKLSIWNDTTVTGARLFEIINRASTTLFSISDQGTTTIAGNLDVNSTIASSTFANGLVIEGGTIQLDSLLSCSGGSTLDTDGSGVIVCGTDATSGTSDLDGLTDTTMTATSTGDILVQGSDDKWINLGLGASSTLLISNGTTLVYQATSTLGLLGGSDFSGDILVTQGGVATIQANAVVLSDDTSGNFLATLADDGGSTLTVSNSGTENAAVVIGINLSQNNAWTGTGTTTFAGDLRADGISAWGWIETLVLNATSTSASSTISHGLNVAAINQTGNSTSTFAQGIDLSAGCFAVDGTCITGGGGAFTSSGGFTTMDTASDLLGIGTSSPYAKLSVLGDVGAQTPLFVLASSSPATTTTVFEITNDGALKLYAIDPLKVGGAQATTSARAIAISGDYAYVIGGASGAGGYLEIFNIATTTPFSIGLAATADIANGISIYGNYAYVVSDSIDDDLEIFDISDPTNPVKVGGAAVANSANGISISGNYAYVASNFSAGNEFEIFDISDPTSPVRVGGVAVGGAGANANGIIISGNYAYVVSDSVGGNEFEIFDISDPTNPVKVGGTDAATSAKNVAISGNYAYVVSTAANDDLEIFDISNPTNPVKVGGTDTGGNSANGISISGNYAYVVSEVVGDNLEVFDISSSTAPVKVGGAGAADNANDIVISGNRAYVVSNSTGDDLEIFELSGITATAAEIGTLKSNIIETTLFLADSAYVQSGLNVGRDTLIGGALRITGNASSTLAENYTALSVANGNTGFGTSTAYSKLSLWADGVGTGAIVFEITDNASTTLFSIDDIGNATTSGYLAVTGSATSTFAQGIDSSSGCFAINGTCDSAFVSSGGFTTMLVANDLLGIGTSSPYAKLSVTGNVGDQIPLFVLATSSPATTTTVFEISNSGALKINQIDPLEVGEVYDGTGNARGIFVSGNYAYVADNTDGLEIIDISDPTNPVEVGQVVDTGNAYSVFVSGNYAYVADNTDGLEIIDISDPTNPVEVGQVVDTGSARGVFVSGNYAYVVDNTDGLEIIDISDPLNPVEVGSVDDGGNAVGVFVSGNYAYVADSGDGLEIIDISDPTNPVEVGQVVDTGSARDVFVSGNYAYVADSGDGLEIIDISSSTNPFEVGQVVDTGSARGVFVSGNYAYVADSTNGLEIIDISSSTNPFQR